MRGAGLPEVYLARHGETAWSLSGQHTGRTDLPLTAVGETNAAKLRDALKHMMFTRVFSSPLRRAWQTCELAGFRSSMELVHDLVEWDYGEYEGRRTDEIVDQRPDWELFRDGCPGGESPQEVAMRADRVVDLVRSVSGNVLLFSSGHFLRMLAARWTGMDTVGAKSLMLSTASLSVLGYETRLTQPAIRLWNDTHHLLSDHTRYTHTASLALTEVTQGQQA
ncbi:MAG TPA: histidine phosphatase family protein [Pyrinomonadaceae bacterium]